MIAGWVISTVYQDSHRDSSGLNFDNSSTSSPNSVQYQDVSPADIQNANYSVWGENVKFIDGKFKNSDPHDLLNSTVDYYTIADINGDGVKDALVVTTTSRADSIDNLHYVLKQNGQVITTPLSIPIAKGEAVRNISKVSAGGGGLITVYLLILAPNDPTYNPTIQGDYQYKFKDGRLVPLK